jgi:hypothetical protein
VRPGSHTKVCGSLVLTQDLTSWAAFKFRNPKIDLSEYLCT